jgi:hypothetical protein
MQRVRSTGGEFGTAGRGVRDLQSGEQDEIPKRGMDVEEISALNVALGETGEVLLVPHHIGGMRNPKESRDNTGGEQQRDKNDMFVSPVRTRTP